MGIKCFCLFGRDTTTINLIEYEYYVCFSSRRLFPLFLWNDFIQQLPNKNERKLSLPFYFIFCYFEFVLSLTNSMSSNYVHHNYPIEREIRDTINTTRSASYLDLHLETDREVVKNSIIRQNRRFLFSYCELSKFM